MAIKIQCTIQVEAKIKMRNSSWWILDALRWLVYSYSALSFSYGTVFFEEPVARRSRCYGDEEEKSTVERHSLDSRYFVELSRTSLALSSNRAASYHCPPKSKLAFALLCVADSRRSLVWTLDKLEILRATLVPLR